jgi:hypothetical protein
MVKVTIKKATGNKSQIFQNPAQAQQWLKRQADYCREMGQKVFGYKWEK